MAFLSLFRYIKGIEIMCKQRKKESKIHFKMNENPNFEKYKFSFLIIWKMFGSFDTRIVFALKDSGISIKLK